MVKSILFFTLVFSLSTQANILAILDSGVDYKHSSLIDQMWNNPGEIKDNRRDEDGNGYRDDFYGWNFAGGNSEVINYNYLGSFSERPIKYLEIQNKVLRKTATAEEIEWLKNLRNDKTFIKEMSLFGNFAHGTHVARISSRIATDSKIMALKLLPTEMKEKSILNNLMMKSKALHEMSLSKVLLKEKESRILRFAVKTLAETQASSLSESFNYIGDMGASVMNGSFGTSPQVIRKLTDAAFTVAKFRKPTEEESLATVRMYFEYNLATIKGIIEKHPKTLFVFAAGNDGNNNDIVPSSPAGVKLDNVVSVAATIDEKSLASFSNFGAGSVDIAAPGVGIKSAIPTATHNDFSMMSGTSQAAPYIAGVAAKIRSINKNLSAPQTKRILMETVDKKDFLFRKVVTNGLVNSKRAFTAAELSLKMPVDQAIAKSQSEMPMTVIAATEPTSPISKKELDKIAPIISSTLVSIDADEIESEVDSFIESVKN